MPTFDEYRVLPVADRLSRLRRTPGELEKAISDRDDAELGRRPDAWSWSAKEILCHLRDVEELFQLRFHTVVALDEPRILVLGATPDELAPWRIGGSISTRSTPTGGSRSGSTPATTPGSRSRPSGGGALKCCSSSSRWPHRNGCAVASISAAAA